MTLTRHRLDAGSITAVAASLHAGPLQVEVLDSVDSTNSELLRRARDLDVHASALLAEHQTGGRGRRGRRWEDRSGEGLCLSLAWKLELQLDRLQGLSLILGEAAVDALRHCGVDGLGLKWPNDLLLDGRKLGGILLELRDGSDGRCLVVAGIGVNVHGHGQVDPLRDEAERADLAGLGIDRNTLAARVIVAWSQRLATFRGEGLGDRADAVRRLDVLRGRAVRLDGPLGTGAVEGVADGITDQGALRIRTGQGAIEVAGGEVSVRRVAPAS